MLSTLSMPSIPSMRHCLAIDWPYLRGLLATGLHQLPAAIDSMPLPDAWELLEHWQRWPPAHVLLNGFVGWKQMAPLPDSRQMGELQRLLGRRQRMSRELRELVDWAEKSLQPSGISDQPNRSG